MAFRTLISVKEKIHSRLLQGAAIPDILWSKGLPAFCDVSGPRSYHLASTESVQDDAFFLRHYADPHGVVWLRLGSGARVGKLCDLDIFVRSILPKLQQPITLLTTDGDCSVPSDINPKTVSAILESHKIIAWYSQNHDGTVQKKLHPFPIGLDLHTNRKFQSPKTLMNKLHEIRKGRQRMDVLPRTIFCDAHLSQSSPERYTIQNALRDANHVIFLERRVSQILIWRHYGAHPFVISPTGWGIDCHRTWEALLLGSIVITRHVPIAPLFEGLAIWQINEWSELRDTKQVELQFKRLSPLTSADYVWCRLKATKWIEKIHQHIEGETTSERNS
ncbi:MAG: hypothetical protein ABIN69_15220 [Aestuariivirga sp.]